MGASDYLETVYLFKLLMVAEFVRNITTFYAIYLSYRLKVYKSILIGGVGAMMNVILLYVFLAKYGIVFAACSSIVSSLVVLCLVYVYAYKDEKKFVLNCR